YRSTSGLQLTKVLNENKTLVDALRSTEAVETTPELPTIEGALNLAQTVLTGCTWMGDLELHSRTFNLEAPVTRCRVAFEKIKAFVRRRDRHTDARLRTVGHAYAEGKLRIEDAAKYLGVSRTDVVFLFERFGFAREPSVMMLSPEEHRDRLAAIRKLRL